MICQSHFTKARNIKTDNRTEINTLSGFVITKRGSVAYPHPPVNPCTEWTPFYRSLLHWSPNIDCSITH